MPLLAVPSYGQQSRYFEHVSGSIVELGYKLELRYGVEVRVVEARVADKYVLMAY